MTTSAKRRPPGRPRSEPSPWASVEPDGSDLAVENFPSTLIVQLANALRRTVTAPYAETFGLTVSEWRFLAMLARLAPARFIDLVDISGSDKAQVSRGLQALLERGLAEVCPGAETSKKKLSYRLTKDGMALYKRVLPHARARQASLLACLGKTERAALFSALKKLQRKCQAMEAEQE
ncbi:MarR family winged helix-turn-helix transcriptional regulator [Pigmentiphaga sp. YJ18]|uniref:MarR family winged helix-turn-helix transcriptional regulator n=1 Tax=Pigmentiphaga sp. YJ18 TaxID=3134907 RepID=UPI00310E58A0